MNVLVLYKFFIQIIINLMRLVRVHGPSILELEIFILQFIPSIFLYHKLPCYFIPSLLPIYSCINYQDCHIINSSIHSYQAKPTVLHRSKLIIIDNQSIVIQLVLIHRSLKVKLNRILGAQFMYRNYTFFYSLYFSISFDQTFERSNKKAIRAFLNLAYLNIFRRGEIFPFFSMFDIHFLRNVADRMNFWILLQRGICVLPVLMINVFKSFLCIIFEGKVGRLVFNQALVISEYHCRRSKKFTFLLDLFDNCRWRKSSFFKFKGPVIQFV